MTANWSRNQWIYNKHLGWEKNDRMRINPYYENLIKRVIELSVDDIWEGAVQEWEIVDWEIDESMSQACVAVKIVSNIYLLLETLKTVIYYIQ